MTSQPGCQQAPDHRPGSFEHEALLYAGVDEFIGATEPMIRAAIDDERATLVATTPDRVEGLRTTLGDCARDVQFEDITDVGRNPARLTALWRTFVDEHGSSSLPAFGIGEPVWAGRSEAELVEAQLHELLLNEALAHAPLRLVCPYDVDALDGSVIDAAADGHALIRTGEARSARPPPQSDVRAMLEQPLQPRPRDAANTEFTDPSALREFLRRHMVPGTLDHETTDNALIAVSELAANTLQHAPGPGTASLWRQNDTLICEVADGGRIDDPLAGRRPPGESDVRGRGLWIVNQLCDLVQLRSSRDGTVVRIHLHCRNR